jgi:hypothetical protein
MSVEIGHVFPMTLHDKESFGADLALFAKEEMGVTRTLLDDEIDWFFQKFSFNQACFGDNPLKARTQALRHTRIIIEMNNEELSQSA